jgi:DNA gyrase subunit B
LYRITWAMRKDKDVYEYTEDKITVNYTDKERVRQSPAIYLPSTEKEGCIHLFEEAFANAIDEVCAPNSIGYEVIVTLDEADHIMTVQDNGRGIPFGKLFEVCEVLSSSGKMGTDSRAYNTSTGQFGHGLKLVNYYTAYMKVRVDRDGKFIEIMYIDGERVDVKEGKSTDHGTYIEWKNDKRFFKDININCDEILDKLKKKSYVVPGITMIFTGKPKNGSRMEITKEFKNTKFKDYLDQFEIDSPIVNGKASFGDASLEFLFGYESQSDENYNIIGYTNNTYNKIGGSHVEGMLDGISTAVRKYMMDTYLTDKDKKDLLEKDKKEVIIKPEDIRQGLIGIISLHALNPEWKGQYKEGLNDEKLKAFVFKSVRNVVRDFDVAKLNKICSIIKANMKARLSAENNKKRVYKDITNIFSEDKIAEYVPISKYSTSTEQELEICEGLSAKGNLKAGRDEDSQAILTLRGKVENIFDLEPREAVKKSKFLWHMVQILECENDDIMKFDIDKCPFTRINIMTDADVDGDEISCQISMILAKFFSKLVTTGRVYKVVPPLYEVIQDGKSIFVPTIKDFMRLTQRNFAKKHTLYLNDKKVKEENLIEFLIRHERYVESINRLANQYATSPSLCEFILANKNIGFENDKMAEWNKVLPSRFRFIKANEGLKYLTFQGMIGNEFNLFDYTEEFLTDVEEMYKISTDDNFYGYSIDKVILDLSLYSVMKEFAKYQPKIEARFKGLGEMTPEDLERTLLKKDMRHSIRLTMVNGKLTYEKMSVMHSKKKDYPARRKTFMSKYKFDLLDIDT